MRQRFGTGVLVMVAVCAVASAALAAAPLTRWLAHPGEEPGFVAHGPPQVFSTAAKWTDVERPAAARRDAARLRREGFVVGVFEAMSAPGKLRGGSSALELGSAADAQAELRAEMREAISVQGRASIHRFAISGVPGARAFTAVLGVDRGDANAFFTEGRCVMVTSDQGTAGDVAQPVTHAVQAIFHRTGGHCP
jgi:hypothetical protein